LVIKDKEDSKGAVLKKIFMFKYARKIVLGLVLLAVTFFSANYSYAANSFFSGEDFPNLVRQIYIFGSSIVGAVAVAAFVLAGIFYMTAQGNQERVKKAKEMFGGALVGLFLVMGSYLILKTLNPQLVELQIEVPRAELNEAIEKEKIGKGSGKACVSHADCEKEELCQPVGDKGEICTERKRGQVKEGDSCNKNDDCKSGICVTEDINECAPEKGMAKGGDCDEDHDCESGVCNDGDNECASSGGKACSKDDECAGKVCEDSVCVAGSAPGTDCNRDKDCASKICNTKDLNKCTIKGGNPGTSPFPTSNACSRDKDCASKVCNFSTAPDTCVPIGGAEKGTACSKDEACKSKICNRALGVIDDGQCTPEGGSANGADCKTKRDCKSGFCKPTSVGDDECAAKP